MFSNNIVNSTIAPAIKELRNKKGRENAKTNYIWKK